MNRFRTVLFLLLLSACAGRAETAQLAGEPVSPDEYAFYAGPLRTQVASRLMREHGVGPTAEFWTTEFDGVSAGETLHQETLRAIARARVVQRLAFRNGLLGEVKSHRQLVEAFHAENRRRAEMKARGEVFYGPVAFRQDVWFQVWFRQVEKALQRHALQAMALASPGPKDEAAAAEEVEKEIQTAVSELLGSS